MHHGAGVKDALLGIDVEQDALGRQMLRLPVARVPVQRHVTAGVKQVLAAVEVHLIRLYAASALSLNHGNHHAASKDHDLVLRDRIGVIACLPGLLYGDHTFLSRKNHAPPQQQHE